MRKGVKAGLACAALGCTLSACTIYTNTDANVNVDAGGLEAILHRSVSDGMELVPSFKCGFPSTNGSSEQAYLYAYWWASRTVNELTLYGDCTQNQFNALYTSFGGNQAAQAAAAFQDMGSVYSGSSWLNAAFTPGVEQQSGAGWVPGNGCYVFQMGPAGNYEYWTTSQSSGCN